MKSLAPVVAMFWGLFAFCVLRGRQRIRNSFVLLCAIMVTMFSIAGIAGYHMKEALIAEFAMVVIVLLCVPFLLIGNGIVMTKKEGRCMANRLSMLLGIAVAIGEACFIASFFLVTDPGDLSIFAKIVTVVGWSALYFCTVFLSFVLYVIAVTGLPHIYNYDYIIIHGCGLIGGEKVSKLLGNRIDKAIDAYQRCMKRAEKKGTAGPILIPSGGKGYDEKLSESQAMKNYLLEKGIPEERIIMEDKSPSTRTNLINSFDIIQGRGGGKIALVTSNYHVYRCLALAKELKIKCTGIGAPVAQYFWPSAVIREFAAVFSNKKKLFWLLMFWAMNVALLVSIL